MRKKFKLILFGLTLFIIMGVANAAPVITPNPAAASFTNVTDDLPQAFDVTVSETTDITWYLDGSSVQSVNNQTSDSYSSSPSAGVHNVTVVALNTSTSQSSQFEWTWTVNESLSIDSSSPGSNPSTTVGDSQEFTVGTNQIADITWYIDGSIVQTNTSQTSASYTNSTAPTGTYTVKATATNVNGTVDETWTWEVTAIPAPSITLEDPSYTSVSDNTGDSRTFTVSIDQTVNLTWILNGTTLATNNSVDSASYTFNSAPEGSHNLTVYAENANGTDQEKWDWTVTAIPLSITDSNPSSNPESTVGSAQIFNLTVNKISDIKWYINGSLEQTNSSALSAEFTKSDASVGTYNVTATAQNGSSTVSRSWIWNVRSKTYSTGDRIWDENAGQSTTYTWDAKSFSGFFYDLESGLSSESMTISDIDRSLGDGDIVYETRPVETDFEHSDWGSYQIIGFMAEKYFAGYTDDTDIEDAEEVSMMSAGQLSKILIDDDEKESAYAGSSLSLEDGYELNIVEVDVNGNSVFVTLTKDGDELDSDVVSGGSDYVYKDDLGDADDVVILAVHFDEVFSGVETSAVFVEGIFQISDDYLELDDGDNYGEMEITSIGDDLIEMENDGTVSLSKGKSITLMGKIKLIVADNADLRFAPYVDMSDPGTYELRGTVAEDDDLLTWTPLNFEGFYYDIDEGIQTETLELTSIDGRKIPAGALEYTSTAKSVEFEHSSWGDFDVIGFMAEKYFAGYNDDTDIDGVDEVSLLSDGQLSEVLMDDDDKVSVYSGSSLVLEEGYTLDIVEVDVNGESVLIELYQDGDEVDTDIVSADGDYVYDTDLGDSDDVPLIIIHFNEVFRGTESNAVFVEGIFQISEDYISLESGDTYGEMEIDSFSDTSIEMSNEDSISLSKDKEIELMGDVGIKVADSSTLRYYPFVEVTTAASQTLSIELSDSTVLEDEEMTITVTARGASIGDATVKVDGTTIGTTDDDGTLDYTPSTAGTYEITAEKDGYASGSEDLEVIDKDDETRKMSIEVSPDEVYEGTSMTIFVLKAIGGDAISGAEVTFDGKSIGTTGSDGTVTYTATETGTHKLIASKSGMADAELDLKVEELAAKFEFSNLEISPLEIKQGQEATISVDVTNTGTADGDYTVDLKINDEVVDSQLVSLSMGDSTTIEFTHAEDEIGTYDVKVGSLSTTYEVFEKSGTIWYVLGAIALAAIGGAAYLFTAGGWTVEIAQAKVAEAIEELKELVGNLR